MESVTPAEIKLDEVTSFYPAHDGRPAHIYSSLGNHYSFTLYCPKTEEERAWFEEEKKRLEKDFFCEEAVLLCITDPRCEAVDDVPYRKKLPLEYRNPEEWYVFGLKITMKGEVKYITDHEHEWFSTDIVEQELKAMEVTQKKLVHLLTVDVAPEEPEEHPQEDESDDEIEKEPKKTKKSESFKVFPTKKTHQEAEKLFTGAYLEIRDRASPLALLSDDELIMTPSGKMYEMHLHLVEKKW